MVDFAQTGSTAMLAWGKHVSAAFRLRVIEIAKHIHVDPSYLMACMAFETGTTFNPSIHNAAGSGAVGLIQFMPSTAGLLGTTTEALSQMSAEEQLLYVEKYFQPFTGRLLNLGDTYGAVIWPGMIGKADNYLVFSKFGKRPVQYFQNKGLDINHDGEILRSEIYAKVEHMYNMGLNKTNAA